MNNLPQIVKELIIEGSRIRYIEKQCADDIVYIFLHGWGSSYKLFSQIYEELDCYIAFDFPGFGESSRLEKAWTLEDYAKTTKKFLDKKTKGKKLIFVAHSFGGRVLLKLLDSFEVENIVQIVCIGVPFTREFGLRESTIYSLTKIAGRVSNILPRFLSRSIRLGWYQFIGAKDYVNLKGEFLKSTFQSVISEDMCELVHVLSKYKTDLIWGSNDKEAPLHSALLMSRNIDAKLYIIEGGGHFPFLSKPYEFNNVFRKITSL